MPDFSNHLVHPTIRLSRYADYLRLARQNGYHFIKYPEVSRYQKFVILRHDIDLDLECALQMAQVEHSERVSATYFIMLHNELYSPFSLSGRQILQKILQMGHTIGLHFDPTFWKIENTAELIEKIHLEVHQLSQVSETKVHYVSFHQPSPVHLNQDYQDPVFESVYNSKYINSEIRYIADSMGMWREESIEELLRANRTAKIHFLSHPLLWVFEKEEKLADRFEAFLQSRAHLNRHLLASAINDKSKDIVLFKA